MDLISPPLKQRFNALLADASTVIHRHAQPPMADELDQLRQHITVTEQRDTYGQGGVVTAFEQQLAALFNTPACVFLPTGTLAQCAALKCHAADTGKVTIGLHPTSHLLLHEHMAVETLWGLDSQTMGKATQVMSATDVQHLDPATTAAIVVETPMREIGGALPTWQSLCALRDWCDSHNVRLHADGARIWQVTEAYQRSLADIAALFDSIYVSFYKDLGGISGAALLGTADLISDSKIWARRAGGNPITQYPQVLSARQGLATYLPHMPAFVAFTSSLCAALSARGITLIPETPQVAMFHLVAPMDAETLTRRILAHAEQTHVVALPLPRAGDQHHCICEISIGDQAVAHSPDFWASHINRCLNTPN